MEVLYVVSFRSRSNCIDEVSQKFLKLLVSLGGYCTATQAQSLFPRSASQVRGRLKMLERLGFLRRITKYPVVYQVTKSTTRLLTQDSSSRRRHTLPTVQARLLAVHFYLEAQGWPAEFVLEHEKKIAWFTENGCLLSALPQRGGKPYLREHFMLWKPECLAIAMIDQPQPKALYQLRVFIEEFRPLLGRWRNEPDLLIVTADKGRCYVYERLLKRHPAIHKLGLGELHSRVKPYSVKPPVPCIAELTWLKREDNRDFLEDDDQFSHGHVTQKASRDLVYE